MGTEQEIQAAGATQNSEPKKKMSNYFQWLKNPTFVVTFLLFIATVGLYCATRDLANGARDQLTLAYPPQLKVSHFQIWEKGHGKAFDRSNALPRFISGIPISGDLLIVNHGREDAFVVGGGCLAHWQKEPRLPMNSPLRPDNPDIKFLKYIDNMDKFKDGTVYKVVPGQFFGCEFETNVQDGKNFYVLGYIHFLDRLKTLRARYFARRYDPVEGVFSAVKDEPDYEGED